MKITVNAQSASVPAGTTVADLVSERTGRPLDAEGMPVDGSRLAMAVAVDDVVVPRHAWAATVLVAGARVDLVTAVQGG